MAHTELGVQEMAVVGAPPRRTPLDWVPVRGIALSLLAAPACCYWAQDQGVDRIFSLMVPPVVLTLVVVALNAPLRRFAPRRALTTGDLVVFYAMQSVICAMASEWMDLTCHDMYAYGVYADRSAAYRSKILPYVRDWLFFTSDRGLEDFRAGGKTFGYFCRHLGIWWPKIIAWTIVTGLVCMAMLAVNSLMRDEWTNRERLAFPIIQLPMAITQPDAPVWQSRLLWSGFAAMLAVDTLNGFSFLYPALPRINVRFLAEGQLWLGPPLNQVGWIPIGFFPYMAAIGFFMPTDLLFSCVLFYFVRKLIQVAAVVLGYEQGLFAGSGIVPGPPYLSEQSWGAFFGLFVTAAWVARGYLREVWRQIARGGSSDPRTVPHRFAFGVLIASLTALGLVGIGAGLPFPWVVAYILIYLVFSIALTRMRAQLGPPSHEMAFVGPNQIIVDFRGTQGLAPSTLSRTVTLFHFMNRTHRTDPMPVQLEAMKMAENARVNQRGLFLAIVIATIAGSVGGQLACIYIAYHRLPRNWGGEPASVASQLIDSPRGPNTTAMAVVVASCAFVLLLDFLRFRVPGFPLHPVGYALSGNFGVDYYWFGLLVVLLIKASAQRYGGLKAYHKLREVALGVILAEFVAEGVWGTLAMVTQQATYSISINGRLGWNQ